MTRSGTLDELTEKIALIEATFPRSRKMPDRVALPKLSSRRTLTTKERWTSLLWSIDTAQAHGMHALRGLTTSLAHVINGQALEKLIFDARPDRSPRMQASDLLWGEDLPIGEYGESMGDLMVKSQRTLSVDLNDAAVFPQPWERWRLQRALQNLGPKRAWGAWRQDPNHFGVAWKPWPIVWVSNGNHSTMAALVRGGGKLKCDHAFDFSPVLRAVRTDGAQWLRSHDNTAIAPVTSIPMAAIFVIGQRLIGLKA